MSWWRSGTPIGSCGRLGIGHQAREEQRERYPGANCGLRGCGRPPRGRSQGTGGPPRTVSWSGDGRQLARPSGPRFVAIFAPQLRMSFPHPRSRGPFCCSMLVLRLSLFVNWEGQTSVEESRNNSFRSSERCAMVGPPQVGFATALRSAGFVAPRAVGLNLITPPARLYGGAPSTGFSFRLLQRTTSPRTVDFTVAAGSAPTFSSSIAYRRRRFRLRCEAPGRDSSGELIVRRTFQRLAPAALRYLQYRD